MRLNIFGFGSGAKDAGGAEADVAASLSPLALPGEDLKATKSGLRKNGAKAATAAGKPRSSRKSQFPPPTTESLKKRVKWLLAHLEEFKQRLEPALDTGNTEEFVLVMQNYLAFIAAYTDTVAYDAFELGPAYPEYLKFFHRASLEFAWRMEEKAFSEIVEAELQPWQRMKEVVSECIAGSYARMEELPSLVDFSQIRSIVVLGCGKVPASLFYLQDQTNVPAIVGIDNLQEAVDCANALVSRFKLDRVRVLNADASKLDYSFFDAIYFGPFATPRIEVMKQIRSTARPNATIILREPQFTGTLAFERVLPYMQPAFNLLKAGDPKKYLGRFMMRHYVLRPR
ncbi:MAG TPA: class I SAM-dependent methyltransferase [Candidatus Melainabacteria bacterium]|nr:class I SAM-dependent methyltransferase [Candidatus Melainabacteria bacterium]